MGKMSVIQSSTNADARCIVFCKSQANLLLRAENPKYEATLLKVFDDEGEVYYVWADVNPENAETAFKAVFAGEDEIIPSIEKIQPVKIGEAFNHQDDYYVLVQNHFGDQIIRRITVLSNEKWCVRFWLMMSTLKTFAKFMFLSFLLSVEINSF